MKKIFEKILGCLAKIIIFKYKPIIIGITGSVGKTSTREAIDLVLKNNFFVRSSIKNYNNEIGVPLTIIDALSPGKSIFLWFKIFLKAFFKIIFPIKFPKVLILEMAADKPGDITSLLKIAPPRIGVLTAVSPVHLEKFKTIENVFKEKQKIITSLPPFGWAILNADDEMVFSLEKKVRSKITTYGFNKEADLRIIELVLDQEIDEKNELKLNGLKFKISYHGKIIPVFLPKIIAKHQLYSILAAISVGIAMELNLLEVVESIKDFELPNGRMKQLPGVNNSLIIDDSYNSSPLAVKRALETLAEILLPSGGRKIVVLGEMLELGNLSEEAHLEIGQIISRFDFDILVTVGNLAKKIAEGAKKSGFPEEGIFEFKESQEAGLFIKKKINQGDIILVKGSQGSRMEKAVKEIINNPEKARDLLVRQGKEWE